MPPNRRRKLYPGAVVAVIALVAVPGVVAASRADQAPAPARFAGVVQGSGVKESLGVYASATGRLVRHVRSYGMDWTNNGFAIAPDGTTVYLTLIPHGRRSQSLKLVSVDLATGHQAFVADGQQPAVDDQGDELAFMTGTDEVAVRDLTSGTTRRLSLSRVLDFPIDPLNTQLVWLNDGTTVAAIPAGRAIPVAASRRSTTRSGGPCRPRRGRQPILFIQTPPRPAPLSVTCRLVTAGASSPLAGGASTLAASPTDPASVWIAGFNGRGSSIEQINQAGDATPVINLGRGTLPVAIDRPAQHILYLKGHRPPGLWEATIDDGRLGDAHQLIADSHFATAAW